MKFILIFLTLLVSACFEAQPPADATAKQSTTEVKSQNSTLSLKPLSEHTLNTNQPNLRSVADCYASKISHVQVEDSGKVVKILPDDTQGLRHQKFLVQIASGQTLLFAHNVDVAGRVQGIKVGDAVQFRGEYVYNPKGGIVHWTHHDPSGKHYAGWIKLGDKTYD